MAIYKDILYNIEGRKFKNKAINEEAGRMNLLFALFSENVIKHFESIGKFDIKTNSREFKDVLYRKYGEKVTLWN